MRRRRVRSLEPLESKVLLSTCATIGPSPIDQRNTAGVCVVVT